MNTQEQKIVGAFAKLSREKKMLVLETIDMMVKYPKFSEELQSAVQACEPSQYLEVAQELVRKWREKVA